jgi:sulfate/thiosulfate-binding protein
LLVYWLSLLTLHMKKNLLLLFLAAVASWVPGAFAAETVTLLNASYDVARPFYKDLNPLFAKSWREKKGQEVNITMSHGGSSVQARAVLDGLEADVVTMNQDTDIDILVEKGGLVAKDWRDRFPNHSAPYTSTILFVVRGGNPKGIKDWDDLVKPGVQVIIPNPKTSGNGRYTYLAAWGYALRKFGNDEKKAREFIAQLFKNVPVLDTGGRAATSTFAQRGIGDALLTFENEVYTIKNDPTLGGDKLEPVVPSLSILAEPPIAVVDKYAEKHGTKALAQEYLKFLYTPEAQELAAKYFYRPSDPAALARNAALFKKIELIEVGKTFGGWAKAQQTHFNDGGVFDQIYAH